MKKLVLWLTILTGLYSIWTCAESLESLDEQISNMDSKLFDAFNVCDITSMETLFTKDLEFYHDTGGLTTFDQTIQNTKRNCANNLGLKRTLVKGSQKVYPIKNYGAIQEASHTFCHMENGNNECGTFKFVHIWKKSISGWQLARVVSYGH